MKATVDGTNCSSNFGSADSNQRGVPLTNEQYREGTWNMFEQFEAFWCKFKMRKRMLVQTEDKNENIFRSYVIDSMRKMISKEAKQNSFHTCERLLRLIFCYEQEYFKLKSPTKLDMLTQLVRVCQILNEHSQNYKDEFK